MYITSVEINNFRSFYGYHNFDFNFQDNRNVNVIFGKNGVGKSVFADAIFWCLYGKEFLNFSTQPLYNYNAFDEVDEGNEIYVFVSCKFEQNGRILEIRREFYFFKESNDVDVFITPNSNLSILDHNKEDIVIRGDEFLVFDKFPEFLFSFLFYDDENSEYVEEQTVDSLKRIIAKFRMFDIINTTNSHINSLSRYYIKEIKKIGGQREDFGKILYQQDKILKNIDETKNEINDILNQKEQLTEELQKINLKMSNYSHETHDLLHKRRNLDAELKYLDAKINKCEIRIQKILFKLFSSGVLLSQQKVRYELDKIFNDEKILDSKFSQRCRQIKQLYDDNLMDVDYIKKDYELVKSLKNQYSKVYGELYDINDYLDSFEDKTMGNLESKRKDIERILESLDKKLEHLKRIKNSLNNSLQYNKRLMDGFNESQFSHDIINRRITFCKDAEELGQNLEEELFKSILSKIEDCCNHIFIHHFDMKNKFRKIVFNDSFEIHIFKHSNQIISINDLSSSEKKLLKLSLIFSIYHCLKLKFPIILMDPFSKLDIDKIKGLFDLILEKDDFQIIFILNENTYDDYIKHNFLNDNITRYQLIENNNGTEVISHGK